MEAGSCSGFLGLGISDLQQGESYIDWPFISGNPPLNLLEIEGLETRGAWGFTAERLKDMRGLRCQR